ALILDHRAVLDIGDHRIQPVDGRGCVGVAEGDRRHPGLGGGGAGEIIGAVLHEAISTQPLGRIHVVFVAGNLGSELEVIPVVDHVQRGCIVIAIGLRATAFQFAVLQGKSEIGTAFVATRQLVNATQVELVALLVTVAGFVHYIIGVAGAIAAGSAVLPFVGNVIGQIPAPVAALAAVLDAQVHVIRQAQVVVLVEQPALRNTVGTGAKGHPIDPYLDLALLVDVVAQPGRMQKVIAVVPAVLELGRIGPIGVIEIDAESVAGDIAILLPGATGSSVAGSGIVANRVVGADSTPYFQLAELDGAVGLDQLFL